MPLKVGRDKQCQISFEGDKQMSRVHCRFDYLNSQWVISDGDIDSDKSSGNGTWFYCDYEHLLRNEDIIYVGNSLFQVEIVQNAD